MHLCVCVSAYMLVCKCMHVCMSMCVLHLFSVPPFSGHIPLTMCRSEPSWGPRTTSLASQLGKQLHLCCQFVLNTSLWLAGLLYQEYRDKSTLQEIETRRKQDAEIQAGDDGSPASEEAPEEEEEAEEEELASPPERKALPQICLLSNPHSRFNLWQDLPEIRSSGVLDILQPEEIRLQEVKGLRGKFPTWGLCVGGRRGSWLGLSVWNMQGIRIIVSSAVCPMQWAGLGTVAMGLFLVLLLPPPSPQISFTLHLTPPTHTSVSVSFKHGVMGSEPLTANPR